MSVDKFNQTYKKTSFLTGVNSDYIEEYYSLYLQSPNLLTRDWIEFFDGLKEDSENIIQNIKGPSWSPKKSKLSIKKIEIENKDKDSPLDFASTKQASTDSVRTVSMN